MGGCFSCERVSIPRNINNVNDFSPNTDRRSDESIQLVIKKQSMSDNEITDEEVLDSDLDVTAAHFGEDSVIKHSDDEKQEILSIHNNDKKISKKIKNFVLNKLKKNIDDKLLSNSKENKSNLEFEVIEGNIVKNNDIIDVEMNKMDTFKNESNNQDIKL